MACTVGDASDWGGFTGLVNEVIAYGYSSGEIEKTSTRSSQSIVCLLIA